MYRGGAPAVEASTASAARALAATSRGVPRRTSGPSLTPSGRGWLRPCDPDAADVEEGRVRHEPRHRDHGPEDDQPDGPPEPPPTLRPQHFDPPVPNARVDRLRPRRSLLLRRLPTGGRLRAHVSLASSPTTWSSGTSSTPLAFATRRCTSATRSSTSRAGAPGSAWKKFACLPDPTAPPTRRPLSPAASMSRPALSPGGLRNTEPAFCPPGWCSRRHRTISATRASHAAGSSRVTVNSAAVTTSLGRRFEWR